VIVQLYYMKASVIINILVIPFLVLALSKYKSGETPKYETSEAEKSLTFEIEENSCSFYGKVVVIIKSISM
jgi:hypothetical protein